MANAKIKDLVNLKVTFKKTSPSVKYVTRYKAKDKDGKLVAWSNGRVVDKTKPADAEGNFEMSPIKKGVIAPDRKWVSAEFSNDLLKNPPKQKKGESDEDYDKAKWGKYLWVQKFDYPVVIDGEDSYLTLTWLQNKGFKECVGDIDWREDGGVVVKIKNGEKTNTYEFELIEKLKKEAEKLEDDGFETADGPF